MLPWVGRNNGFEWKVLESVLNRTELREAGIHLAQRWFSKLGMGIHLLV